MAEELGGLISDDDWFESDYMDAEDYRNVHGDSNVGDFSWSGQDMWNTSPAQSNDMHGLLGGGFNEYDGTTGENVFGGNQDLLQTLTPFEQAYKNVVNRNNKSRNRLAQRFNQNNTIKNVDVTSPLTQVGNAFGTFGDNILKYNEIAGKGIIDIGKSVPAAYARGAGGVVKLGKTLGNVAFGEGTFDENDPEFHQPEMDYNYPMLGKTSEVLGSYLGGATGGVKLAQNLPYLAKYASAILGGTATTDPTEGNLSTWLQGTDYANPVTGLLDSKVSPDASSLDKLGAYAKNFAEEGILSGPIDYGINLYMNPALRQTTADAAVDLFHPDRLGAAIDKSFFPNPVPDMKKEMYGYHSGSKFDTIDPTKQNDGRLGTGHYMWLNEQNANSYPGEGVGRWQFSDDYKERTINYGVAEQSETVKNAFANISKKYDFEVTSQKMFGRDEVFYDDMYSKLSDKFGEREAQDMLRAEGVIGNRGDIGRPGDGAVQIYHPDDVKLVVDADTRLALNAQKAEQKALHAERIAEAERNKPHADRSDLNLFSVLEENLLRLKQETNLSADVKVYLNKQGVKTNELEDTGLLKYLDENKTVTKSELLDQFGANKTELTETVLGKNVSQHDKDMFNAAADSLRLTRPEDFPTNAEVTPRHPEATINETATFMQRLSNGDVSELAELNKHLNAPMASTTQALHEMVEEAVSKGTLDMLPESVMNKVKSAATDMFDARYEAKPMYEWHVGRNDAKYVVTGNEKQGYVVKGPNEFVSYTPNTLHDAEIVINGHATDNNYFPELGDPTKQTKFQYYTSNKGENLDEKSYREYLIKYNAEDGKGFSKRDNRHYSVDNILGHYRVSTKYDVDGNKVFYLHEAQADVIQAGRVRGHNKADNIVKREAAQKAFDGASKQLKAVEKEVADASLEGRNIRAELHSGDMTSDWLAEQRTLQDALLNKLDTAQNKTIETKDILDEVKLGPVADAPMKKDGTFNRVVMNRVLEIAREEGFDKVAIANPKEQLDIYNPVLEYDGKRVLKADGTVLYEELYNNVYGKKLPSELERMANKYGGKYGKTEIVQDQYDASVPTTIHDSLTLTPEFNANIRGGLPLYEAGAIGALGSLLDSDFNEDTPLLLGEGANSVTDSLLDAMTRIDESNITERNAEVDIDSMNDEEFKAYVEYLYSKGLLNNY